MTRGARAEPPSPEPPSIMALRDRLRTLGIAEARLDDAARELATRLEALASVPDDLLERVAPATTFMPVARKPAPA